MPPVLLLSLLDIEEAAPEEVFLAFNYYYRISSDAVPLIRNRLLSLGEDAFAVRAYYRYREVKYYLYERRIVLFVSNLRLKRVFYKVIGGVSTRYKLIKLSSKLYTV